MRILLLTPPMTQINTPYPATAYLTGFLRGRGIDAVQADPALELLLRLLSRTGLEEMAEELRERRGKAATPAVASFLRQAPAYFRTVDAVVRFLQGRDSTLAHRIANSDYLPQGPRFDSVPQIDGADEGLTWAFGSLGLHDRAQYMASLYVDDLADMIAQGIDSRFGLARYAERLAASAPSFSPIAAALAETSLVDRHLDEISRELVEKHRPEVVGLTVPFPGNVYGAFRMAREMKRHAPDLKIVMGGGYVNTELRELKEPRVFDHIDYITLDDGERPLLALLEHLGGGSAGLLRTFVREDGAVVLKSDPRLHDIPFRETGTPSYDGLPLDRYLSLCEVLNPMHRLWSDGRWNKLTLAHGCYWKKCSFCDVNLDYIGRYEDQDASGLVDRIEEMAEKTGQSGFHFVDEAAPPRLLGAMAKTLIERERSITWWGNIRFEKTFTPELTGLLARSGCVAVSGGLEVASDRLLGLMKKGVTVEQVARVTHAFTQSGIMVHAYLMFGFPTQTVAETVDSLEMVRQLFAAGCLQSAFWHRFACTVHSPVGKNPEQYGIRLKPVPSTFATNDVEFEDPTGVDHDALHPGLRKATYNFMHGVGLDDDVRRWFDFALPKTKVPRHFIESALSRSSGKARGAARS